MESRWRTIFGFFRFFSFVPTRVSEENYIGKSLMVRLVQLIG